MQPLGESGIFQFLDTRKEISLIASELKLVAVCDDDSVVCFKGESEIKLCFIDIANQKIVEIPHKHRSYSKKFIDTKRAAVWIWDELSTHLWKHTKEKSVELGALKAGRGVSFLHVDEEDKLYFVD